MSYFIGDDGKTYFPFGQGGRENLLRGCGVLQQHSSISSPAVPKGCGSHASSHEHTEACGAGGSGVTAAGPGAGTGALSGRVENESFQRLQECPLHALPLYTHSSGNANVDSLLDPALPVCVTEPDSQPALVYAALARDVVLEVFKNQVSALLVSYQVTYARV